MHTRYEITGRFDEAADCSGLLYAPLAQPLTFRRSRCYEFDFSGTVDSLTTFVRKTLFDPISQNLSAGPEPWDDYAFVLEFGMKPGALDLEKEAVMTFYHELENPDFQIDKLAIRQRIYVFGDAPESVASRFVRDLVNPAIHTHQVLDDHGQSS